MELHYPLPQYTYLYNKIHENMDLGGKLSTSSRNTGIGLTKLDFRLQVKGSCLLDDFLSKHLNVTSKGESLSTSDRTMT